MSSSIPLHTAYEQVDPKVNVLVHSRVSLHPQDASPKSDWLATSSESEWLFKQLLIEEQEIV